MKRILTILSIVALGLVLTVPANAGKGKKGNKGDSDILATYDKDGNGKIDGTEIGELKKDFAAHKPMCITFTNSNPCSGSIDTPPQLPPPSVLGNSNTLPSSGIGAYGPPIFIRLDSNNSRQNLAWSGVRSYISSMRNVLRASGGGFSGNGCVFADISPGTMDAGTARSSIP